MLLPNSGLGFELVSAGKAGSLPGKLQKCNLALLC